MRIFATLILGLVMLCISSVEVNAVERGYVPEVGRVVRPNMVVVAEEDRGDYVCKMVEFSVDDTYTDSRGRKIRSKERINGYLLVPDVAEKGKCPALVMLHDHGARFDIGKEKLVRPIYGTLTFGEKDHVALSSRQWIDKNFDGACLADSLAAKGYVVLVTDALYWGERSSEDAQRWSELTYGSTDQYTLDSDRMLDAKSRKAEIKSLKKAVYEGQRDIYADLQSRGVIWAEKILRDDVASVKLLAGLPYVDESRIGAFGFSMGAHRCWLLAAFCKEVKCGVALSWMTTLDGYEGNNASDLSMRIQPMRDRMDFGDIGKYLAPKPMLFLSGETDHLFPKDKVQKAYKKLQSHYSSCEADGSYPIRPSDALRTEFFPGGHHCGKYVQSIILQAFGMML
jgi:dienelactone hydrolase